MVLPKDTITDCMNSLCDQTISLFHFHGEIGIKRCNSISAMFSGQDVVLVKSGRRICGSGAGLANAPIAQNKAYFEIKIQSSGK